MDNQPPIHESIAHLKKLRENAAELFRSLDKEITRLEALVSSAPTPPPIAPPPLNTLPKTPPPPPAAEIPSPIEIAQSDAQSIKSDVQRGCFLYVAIATLLLAAVVYGLFWLSSRKHREPQPTQTEVFPH